jgi:hypothetical protein
VRAILYFFSKNHHMAYATIALTNKGCHWPQKKKKKKKSKRKRKRKKVIVESGGESHLLLSLSTLLRRGLES